MLLEHFIGVTGNLRSQFPDGKPNLFHYSDIKAPDSVVGAIIGDIAGSRFEFNFDKPKTKDEIELIHKDNIFTDDTVLSVMLYEAARILSEKGSGIDVDDIDDIVGTFTKYIKYAYQSYPNVTWGDRFIEWCKSEASNLGDSFGNGSAMRVGFTGIYDNPHEALAMATMATITTHNSTEGVRGARCVTECIQTLKRRDTLHTKEIIPKILYAYYPEFNTTVEELHETYEYTELCDDTVPQAIQCFIESHSFKDAIKNAIYIGGDSDTIAAITGSLASMYYGVPKDLKEYAFSCLTNELKLMLLK